jgi:hypothetical protein
MAKVKRYVVFACQEYYPAGGWDDFIASFDTEAEAETCEAEQRQQHDWVQIIDMETGDPLPYRGESGPRTCAADPDHGRHFAEPCPHCAVETLFTTPTWNAANAMRRVADLPREWPPLPKFTHGT